STAASPAAAGGALSAALVNSPAITFTPRWVCSALMGVGRLEAGAKAVTIRHGSLPALAIIASAVAACLSKSASSTVDGAATDVLGAVVDDRADVSSSPEQETPAATRQAIPTAATAPRAPRAPRPVRIDSGERRVTWPRWWRSACTSG